ncbi:hypothetical protein [Actinophytocola sp. KF-1]
MNHTAIDTRRRRPRRRRVLPFVLVGLVVALIYPTVTYVRALTWPGNAGIGVRTVDWLRDDMGAGAVVNTVENWWYSRHPPSAGPPAADTVPRHGTPPAAVRADHPADLPTPGDLPGEGVWVPADRQGALYTTFFQPDLAHGSVLAGAAWFNQDLVRGRLIAGTKEPARDPNAPGEVPPSLLPRLTAVFNAGFKMVDAHGGAFLDQHQIVPLRDGAASAVVHRDGRITVDQWGRDARLSADVVSVQQSLDLIVDHGQAVPGLDVNRDARWGSARSQFQYTWRSGLGTDAAGHLIYVAGNDLTLATLASAMAQVGIDRGMQLDIHPNMVSCNIFDGQTPHRLLPAMPSPANRYLSTDLRAFFAITLRTHQTGSPSSSRQ